MSIFRLMSSKSGSSKRALIAMGICLVLSGCASRDKTHTSSIPGYGQNLAAMSSSQLHQASGKIGSLYAASPKNRNLGLQYATVLRMTGRDNQALAVMQQVAIHHPADRAVLAAYGKAQAAAGDLNKALTTIQRAQTPDHPDWKLLSAEGAILDQLGQSKKARARYANALDIKPGEPSILSNLGMSYLLSGDLRTAETYLKTAIRSPNADSRVRQNLALVVGLQGRFSEAEKIARGELSKDQAEDNVTYLKSMLAQQNSWNKLAAKKRKK